MIHICTHTHTHTHTHTNIYTCQAFLICLPLASRWSWLYIINGGLGESNIGLGQMEIPTLWAFWIMSHPVSGMLVLLYTTTHQPNTPTSYLTACHIQIWVGLLARTLQGFPNQSQIKSPAIRPTQVGNDGKAGPPGYVGKTATQPLYHWVCKYGLISEIYHHVTTLIGMGPMDVHTK